jgi:hypothetical protein
MIFYIVLSFFLLLLTFVSTIDISKNKEKVLGLPKLNTTKVVFLYVMAIAFVLLGGLRAFSVGADTVSNKRIFDYFGSISLLEKVPLDYQEMYGYRILCKLVYIVTNGNYQIFMFIVATITIGCIFYFIYYTSENYVLSVWLFYLGSLLCSSWNVSRQFLALGIALVAIVQLYKGKFLRYFILLLIACTFHKTVFVLFLVLPIKFINWNQKKIIIASIVVAIGVYSLNIFMPTILHFFPLFEHRYLDMWLKNSFWGKGTRGYTSLFYLVFVICTFFVTQKSKRTLGFISDWQLLLLMMISIELGLIFRKNPAMLRIRIYFDIFIVVAIPNMLKRLNLENRKKTLVTSMLVIAYIGLFLYKVSIGEHGVVPYHFFWNK